MTDFDGLLARNEHFATTSIWKEADFRARNAVFVISCLDPRVDPFAFLELTLGDATVVRNVGGRVSQALLDDLAYIGYLQTKVIPGGPKFEVVVIHHTECEATSSPTRTSAAGSRISCTSPTTPRCAKKPSSTRPPPCRSTLRKSSPVTSCPER